jgi:hypothetical protein
MAREIASASTYSGRDASRLSILDARERHRPRFTILVGTATCEPGPRIPSPRSLFGNSSDNHVLYNFADAPGFREFNHSAWTS